jgi:hypothetical protein
MQNTEHKFLASIRASQPLEAPARVKTSDQNSVNHFHFAIPN